MARKKALCYFRLPYILPRRELKCPSSNQYPMHFGGPSLRWQPVGFHLLSFDFETFYGINGLILKFLFSNMIIITQNTRATHENWKKNYLIVGKHHWKLKISTKTVQKLPKTAKKNEKKMKNPVGYGDMRLSFKFKYIQKNLFFTESN